MSNQPPKDPNPDNVSIGSATFGEGATGSSTHRLFRVVPGHQYDYLLEQANVLMSCVYKLTREASLEPDDTLIVAAHYLSGMAKALIEDIAMAQMIAPLETQ
ncbi:DUF3077 domain-containing protein [Pseudomonas sp.]|uniref:DUF3077 domain-containing protein n=1 Tax=Pseudomonas sp. TaxID=306 RepID=UPI0028B05C91|nr:DUF3077 domain-containing protein [Pseudomonas sp.]